MEVRRDIINPSAGGGGQGPPGPGGPAGQPGQVLPPLEPEEPELPLIIPGPPGPPGSPGTPGTDGVAGPPGPPGSPGMDAEEPMLPMVIPGPPGIQGEPGGGGGGGAWTKFTQNLGAARRSGTFDITGLSGLTADEVKEVVQTSDAIASKGNARDEPEMDQIVISARALNTTTIRCLWYSSAGNVVVGTYAFAWR